MDHLAPTQYSHLRSTHDKVDCIMDCTNTYNAEREHSTVSVDGTEQCLVRYSDVGCKGGVTKANFCCREDKRFAAYIPLPRTDSFNSRSPPKASPHSPPSYLRSNSLTTPVSAGDPGGESPRPPWGGLACLTGVGISRLIIGFSFRTFRVLAGVAADRSSSMAALLCRGRTTRHNDSTVVAKVSLVKTRPAEAE